MTQLDYAGSGRKIDVTIVRSSYGGGQYFEVKGHPALEDDIFFHDGDVLIGSQGVIDDGVYWPSGLDDGQ